MKFELVDAVLERDGERIVTVKNVTVAEEYLADHFPSFPVLPGVMMLEAMVQAARKFLETAAPSDSPWVLAEVRNLRYGNMVRPGQQLTVRVERTGAREDRHTFQGRGLVGDDLAVQGRFTLRPIAKVQGSREFPVLESDNADDTR